MKQFAILATGAASLAAGVVWSTAPAPSIGSTEAARSQLIYVVAPSASCRSAPNASSKNLSTLALGDQLNAMETRTGWSQIEFAGGLRCWTPSNVLATERPATSAKPRLRPGAGQDYTLPDRAVSAAVAPAARPAAFAYFPNCRAAWAAGAAPMYHGSPGYRSQLDGDGDGIACEPFRR
jgi:hypothetical protein